MKQKIISQGAEAIIYKKGDLIIKDRIEKAYRLPELDKKLRIRRTRTEKSLLTRASKFLPVPHPLENKNKTKIILPFIKGEKLSEHLDKFPEKKALQICEQIGEQIAKMHSKNIVHGDLTTSNMILSDKKVYFIDFGLGFYSEKTEDKAVDLHLIRQAIEAKHFKRYKKYWQNLLKGYKKLPHSKSNLERLKKVESRGRYKKRV